ncbi:MAG: L-seryl-tRNA(Sec) selenium transferase [Peptostreptococcales bacterium]
MDKKEWLRQLPKVDEILMDEKIKFYHDQISRKRMTDIIRDQIEKVRNKMLSAISEGMVSENIFNRQDLLDEIVFEIEERKQWGLRKVINATGIILHTNLGRALLADEIKEHIFDIAGHYSNLEYDIDQGKRGSRYDPIEKMLTKLTGTEAAFVVNNNAAAIMLILNTLAKDKEVIVSRGELVEIGGSFRIPEIMSQSGTRLKEVGTTNKTHLSDYMKVIDAENTGAFLKIHTSNYRILGFTEEVGLKELAAMGKTYNIPVIHDLGSGCLMDLKEYGIVDEPTIKESVETGADIICFSGDKLLGGPQAGIIIGRKDWIEKMKENPLARAFRVDKLTLAALEATLQIYFSGAPLEKIPTLKMMTMDKKEIREKAFKIWSALQHFENMEVSLVEGFSQIGGGSLPLHELPSFLIQIKPLLKSVNDFEGSLRNQSIPIIARIHRGAILLDCRTIEEEALPYLIRAIDSIQKV